MSQTVVHVPGLPADVEVRRSTRRRRSVTAYREGGRTIVVVPARMARADIPAYVEDLVGRLDARERRGRRTDAQLHARALELAHRYLDDRAEPRTVRWVSNQRRRWGSCTPVDAAIRLSDRLQAMPPYVVDYVLLHELVHLLVPGHGADFEAWMARYPRLLEARAFLAGVDHATGHGLTGDDVDADENDADENDADENGATGIDAHDGEYRADERDADTADVAGSASGSEGTDVDGAAADRARGTAEVDLRDVVPQQAPAAPARDTLF